MSRSIEGVIKEEFPLPGEIIKEAGPDEVGVIYRDEYIELPIQIQRERFVEIEPKIVEKTVEVPEIEIVEKIKTVKKTVEKEKIIEVPKHVKEEKIVEVLEYQDVEVVKEHIIRVPQIEEKVVERVVMVPNYVEVPYQSYVPVLIDTAVSRRGLALFEVDIIKEYILPKPKVVYEDIDVEVRLPKFIQVLPGEAKKTDKGGRRNEIAAVSSTQRRY